VKSAPKQWITGIVAVALAASLKLRLPGAILGDAMTRGRGAAPKLVGVTTCGLLVFWRCRFAFDPPSLLAHAHEVIE